MWPPSCPGGRAGLTALVLKWALTGESDHEDLAAHARDVRDGASVQGNLQRDVDALDRQAAAAAGCARHVEPGEAADGGGAVSARERLHDRHVHQARREAVVVVPGLRDELVGAVAERAEVVGEAAGQVVDDVGAGLRGTGLDREPSLKLQLANVQRVAENGLDVPRGALDRRAGAAAATG